MNPPNTFSPGLESVDQFKQADLASQPAAIQQAPAPAQQPAHAGNFLTHLLPTAGGILGSIVGIPGDILSGGLASVAGAGVGSAGGKALENALEGKNPIQSNDVASGVEGAVGGALGGLGGKILGGVAGKLGSAGENLAKNQAAQDTIDSIAQRYGGLQTKLQGNLGAKDLLLKTKGLGYDIADPNNLVQAADAGNYQLNKIVNGALNDAGPVNLSDYNDIVKNALASQGKILGAYDKVAVGKGRLGYANTQASNLLGQLENLGQGVAKTESDPNALRTLTTDLFNMRGDYPQLGANGVVDRNEKAIYNVIDQVRNDVKNRLYGNPAVNDALTKLQGGVQADEGMGVTPELANHLNQVISSAGSNGRNAADDLLEEMSHNYDLKNLGNAALKNDQVVTTKAGQGRLADDLGAPGVTGNDVTQGVSKGGAFAAALHGHPIAALGAIAPHVANSPQILDTLSRIGGLGAKLAPAAGITAATAAGMGAAPAAAPGAGVMPTNNGIMDGAMQGTEQSPLNQLYATLLANFNASGGVTPNDANIASALANLAPQVQKNNLASTQLSGLPSLYANAGGAQGIGGVLSQISSLIPGTAANHYRSVIGAEQPQLQQLGINPALLPSLMNNPQTAGTSQDILSQLQSQLAY